jgi:methionyl aminopeptidase
MSNTLVKKTTQNGDWKFDYYENKHIFSLTPDSVENRYMQYAPEDIVKTYTNDQEIRAKDFRRAAMVHKIARNNAHKLLVPGAKIKDVVEETENLVLKLFRHNDRNEYFKSPSTDGLAFPVGVSINNIVCHDSSLLIDDRTFEYGDVVKFDFGTHVNGNIIDSAFTQIIGEKEEDSMYKPLLDASRDATYSAIALSGPDARLLEISEVISEIISSYEIELDGDDDVVEITPVNGIGGHNILPYRVHGDKFIFSVPNEELQEGKFMEEGEIYAIETYASTGYGNMTQETQLDSCSHFMLNHDDKNNKKFIKKNVVSKAIKNRNGLPFSLPWINRTDPKFNRDFKKAINSFSVIAYPPLLDVANSKVSQFEHTIMVKEGSVEVFSLGNDY